MVGITDLVDCVRKGQVRGMLPALITDRVQPGASYGSVYIDPYNHSIQASVYV